VCDDPLQKTIDQMDMDVYGEVFDVFHEMIDQADTYSIDDTQAIIETLFVEQVDK
jgi:hypothetical protein